MKRTVDLCSLLWPLHSVRIPQLWALCLCTGLTAALFGFSGVLLKLLGISETSFEGTRKDQNIYNSINDAEGGQFTFDSSALFVPAIALVIVHMVALIGFFIAVQPLAASGSESGLVEVVCSSRVLLSLMPFLKGIFKLGSYGIPWATKMQIRDLGISLHALTFKGQIDFFRVERSSAAIVHCNNQWRTWTLWCLIGFYMWAEVQLWHTINSMLNIC